MVADYPIYTLSDYLTGRLCMKNEKIKMSAPRVLAFVSYIGREMESYLSQDIDS